MTVGLSSALECYSVHFPIGLLENLVISKQIPKLIQDFFTLLKKSLKKVLLLYFSKGLLCFCAISVENLKTS